LPLLINENEMKIENNSMVSLIYELKENNSEGRLIEAIYEKRPLNFIFGSGRLLPSFESNIYSLNSGDSFKFTLNSEMAYGTKREDMIVNLPITVFESEGKINEDICRVGNEVPMIDSEGNPMNGIISEITETFVRMDFNHPMAGIDLFFSGRIMDVRNATSEEIASASHSCVSCGSRSEEGCSGSCS
jgi:FKBP-type peptidyl-prolyl cis-trans isomerase SlyD